MLNQELPEGEGPDSINVLEALLGEPGEALRENLVLAPWRDTHLGIRSGDWMYIPAQGGGGFTAREPGSHLCGGTAATVFTGRQNSDIENGEMKNDAPPAQLYNLKDDPFQRINLHDEKPEKLEELTKLLAKETA